MCRQEIPPDFLERPQLVEVDESQKELEHSEEEYQWFYEGRNGKVLFRLHFIFYFSFVHSHSLI